MSAAWPMANRHRRRVWRRMRALGSPAPFLSWPSCPSMRTPPNARLRHQTPHRHRPYRPGEGTWIGRMSRMESSQSPHRPLPEPQTMGTPSSPAAGPCSANAPSADTPAAGYRRGRGVGSAGGRGTAASARCVRTKNDGDDQRQSQTRLGLYNATVGSAPSIPMSAAAGLALLSIGVLADCAGGAGPGAGDARRAARHPRYTRPISFCEHHRGLHDGHG